MNKEFLNRVVGRIVLETIIDYENKEILAPCSIRSLPFYTLPSLTSSLRHLLLRNISYHCEEVYGLSEEEIEYVWKRYLDIILHKVFDIHDSNFKYKKDQTLLMIK